MSSGNKRQEIVALREQVKMGLRPEDRATFDDWAKGLDKMKESELQDLPSFTRPNRGPDYNFDKLYETTDMVAEKLWYLVEDMQIQKGSTKKSPAKARRKR